VPSSTTTHDKERNMITSLSTRPMLCALAAPLLALTPAWNVNPSRTLAPQDVAMLQALSAPGLGAMRAGRVDAPAPFSASEIADLEAAQQSSAALADLRAGRAMDDDAWPWIFVGAAVVVLLVLL
jgi:hypothetical protein